MKLISFFVLATITTILNLHAEGPVSWHYFAHGKCSAANQEQRLNINKLILETGKNGCSYIVNDLKRGILSLDCPSHDEADVLGIYNLTTSKGACQKNTRILKLLQNRWFLYNPSTQACVDPKGIAEGANLSPWATVTAFPKCIEQYQGDDILQLDCSKTDLRRYLQYATSVEGCNQIRAIMTEASKQ
ncbi:MAG: hypothetical protein KF713_05725 [Turneriella sp.]|nr:hypothetical protein [Turneriella sp.]